MTRYIEIPEKVIEDRSLSDAERILYGRLAKLIPGTSTRSISNRWLAEATRKSERQVSRMLKALHDAGYINCAYQANRDHYSRLITINSVEAV